MKATYLPLALLEEKVKRLWEEGSPHAAVATVRKTCAKGGALYDKWDNEDIGLKIDGEMETEHLEGYLGRMKPGRYRYLFLGRWRRGLSDV